MLSNYLIQGLFILLTVSTRKSLEFENLKSESVKINAPSFSLNSTSGRFLDEKMPEGVSKSPIDFSLCKQIKVNTVDKFKDKSACYVSHVIFEGLLEKINFDDAIEVKGKGIFDSLKHYISSPMSFLDDFKKHYLNQPNLSNCSETTQENETVINCFINDRNLTSLNEVYFVFDGIAYLLEPENFLMRIEDSKYQFLIRFNNYEDNIWIFGQPFLSQYNPVLDSEKKQVALYGGDRVNFYKEWLEWSQKPNSEGNKADDDADDDKMFYLIIGASFMGTLLILFIIFIVVRSIRRIGAEERKLLLNESNSQNGNFSEKPCRTS